MNIFNFMKQFIILLLPFLFTQCFVLNEAGLNINDDIKGKEAKKLISDSISEAEVSALNLWLSQNGMKGGASAIASLVVINGVLAQQLYPYIAKIEDGAYYTSISVLQCTEDIKSKGALSLGLSFSELPVLGLGGPLRDAYLLSEFSSCKLNKTGSLIGVPRVIDL
jgi:small lipoprotein (TIGR04452 family)